MSDSQPEPRDNPTSPPLNPPPRTNASQARPENGIYEQITDTVTGVNVRGSDNLIQLLAVVAATIIGGVIGNQFGGSISTS